MKRAGIVSISKSKRYFPASAITICLYFSNVVVDKSLQHDEIKVFFWAGNLQVFETSHLSDNTTSTDCGLMRNWYKWSDWQSGAATAKSAAADQDGSI